MDLHDDIATSLSQIAILSEVARKDVTERPAAVTHPLARMVGISRELTGARGDIVWAINPYRDHLSDLVQRMRRFGGDLLNYFECLAPSPFLDSAIRRHPQRRPSFRLHPGNRGADRA